MKKLLDNITAEVTKAFVEAGYEEKFGKVTLSNRPDLCEFQCNGAMAAAKQYKKAPFMIADDVAAQFAGAGDVCIRRICQTGIPESEII